MGRPNPRLRREVGRLIRAGRIYRGRWLHVRIGTSEVTDLLVSVRRRYGPAVARNRVRRRVRAICRDMLVGVSTGSFVLVSIGDRSAGAGFKALRKDLEDAFRFLGVR